MRLVIGIRPEDVTAATVAGIPLDRPEPPEERQRRIREALAQPGVLRVVRVVRGGSNSFRSGLA